MIDRGRQNLLGIGIDAVDYDAAVARIVDAAANRRPLGVSALAVHGVMTGVLCREHCYRLNSLELVVPDGQPVRWGLNLLHQTQLRDRVYGPTLTLRVCQAAAEAGLSVFLFGSDVKTLEQLQFSLVAKFPELKIAGMRPSQFRQLEECETLALVDEIQHSGSAITLVGIGCPRQEVFVYELRQQLSMPVLAVGAAFAFHSGNLAQAPHWMQRSGLEWLYRLSREPLRLWRRYLMLNPAYLCLLGLQKSGLLTLSNDRGKQPNGMQRYG